MNIIERKTYGIIVRNIVKGSFVDDFAVGVARSKIPENELNDAYNIYKAINPNNLSDMGKANFGVLKKLLIVYGRESTIRKLTS
jgi:hypothetical protein